METPSLQAQHNYTHFVTLTLKPELYGKTCRQQLRSTFAKANYELQKVAKRYKLVAELTKKCNIHYHALVLFDVTTHFDANDLSMILQDNLKSSNVFGRSESENIKDVMNTYNYVIKDLEKTSKIINPRHKSILTYTKDWEKGMIEIQPIKIKRLSEYLDKEIIDEDINDNNLI